MYRLCHLNLNKAVESFLLHAGELTRLPFISDSEMEMLFGPEVAASLKELERYNHSEKICLQCPGKCCTLVKCELFQPGFSLCPIHHMRPPLCRMHFCRRFVTVDNSFIQEFTDIFLESLLEGKKKGLPRINLFDCPPIGVHAPDIVGTISSLIETFNNGQTDEPKLFHLIQKELEGYHYTG